MELTDAQQQVIAHPTGRHARVLAVAGSGKTTTMVKRIVHLMHERSVAPNHILVIMFNTMARQDFIAKLEANGIPGSMGPRVHNYHSFASQIRREGERLGLLERRVDVWENDSKFKAGIALRKAIAMVTRSRRTEGGDRAAPQPDIDGEEAERAIGIWKGGLVPPDRAGYRGDPRIPLVYAEFERLRLEAHAMTFDDFVPIAVDVLSRNPGQLARLAGTYSHVIVDEYQDVNHGQQVMMELVSSQGTEFMVVGDDDQTIYEWRGARPGYILDDYKVRLAHLPWDDYTLAQTFRFGRGLADAVGRVIGRNRIRALKTLVAHDGELAGQVEVVRDTGPEIQNSDEVLAHQVEALLSRGVPPSQIIVLGRMYAQMSRMEIQLFRRKVPYRVVDHAPFFERREIKTLLAYLHLAIDFRKPLAAHASEWLLAVTATPSVMIPRSELSPWIASEVMRKSTVSEALATLVGRCGPARTPIQRVTQLHDCLQAMHDRLNGMRPPKAADLLDIVMLQVKYLEAFDNAWGEGEEALDKRLAVEEFLSYARELDVTAPRLLATVENADTRRGVPEDEQIRFATVFKVKGLEFDHVFIPRVDEAIMPAMRGPDPACFDTQTGLDVLHDGDRMEGERRLFYVGLTRARICAYVGTASSIPVAVSSARRAPRPSRFVSEMGVTDADWGNLPAATAVPPFRAVTTVFRLPPGLAGNSNEDDEELPDPERVIRHYRSIVVAVDSVGGMTAGFVCATLPDRTCLVATSMTSFGSARHARVSWFGGPKHLARVVFSEPALDLGLLVVRREGVMPATLAPTGIPSVGSAVYGFGIHATDVIQPRQPQGSTGTAMAVVTAGDVDAFASSILVDPLMNGGPLVNQFGEVIGMMSATLSERMKKDGARPNIAVPALFIEQAITAIRAQYSGGNDPG